MALHVLEWASNPKLREARAQEIRRGVDHIVLQQKSSLKASLSINVDVNV